jgi:hypothetical protein
MKIQRARSADRPIGARFSDFEIVPVRGSAILLCLLFFLSCRSMFAQSVTETNLVQFRAVDLYIDSGDKPLAAYQIDFSVAGDAKIIGIEGGEHPAFVQPPFYDPKAMQQERVIVAAFSTNAVSSLPRGKTRVATIHVQISRQAEPRFELKLQAAADANGNRIAADSSLRPR